MNLLLQWAIKLILNWAYSLTKDDLAVATSYVLKAEKQFVASADKKKWAKEQIQAALPYITGRATNFLIELAVAKLPK